MKKKSKEKGEQLVETLVQENEKEEEVEVEEQQNLEGEITCEIVDGISYLCKSHILIKIGRTKTKAKSNQKFN